MISGKINGVYFEVNDEGIECRDEKMKRGIEEMRESIAQDWKTWQGDADYELFEVLKKSGAKDIKYENTEPAGRVY